MSDTPVQPTVGVGAEEPGLGANGAIDRYFGISSRGSTQRREIIAGVTTFLAMVYSVFVVPGMPFMRWAIYLGCPTFRDTNGTRSARRTLNQRKETNLTTATSTAVSAC